MVDFTFDELTKFVAEISLILIALALIVLMAVFPNENTVGLFKDILLLIVGAIVGIVGGKQLAKEEVKEAKEEVKESKKEEEIKEKDEEEVA